MKEKNMKKHSKKSSQTNMRDEYDFSTGVRGKYATQYAKGSNVVVLDPDVAKVFSDAKSVNDALRTLAKIVDRQTQKSSY